VIFFVFNNVIEDGDGARIAQFLSCSPYSQCRGFVDLQTTQAIWMPPARLANESASPCSLPLYTVLAIQLTDAPATVRVLPFGTSQVA